MHEFDLDHRSFSWQDRRSREQFSSIILRHCTPETHPRVADLLSGNYSGAKIVAELGWKPENITCIDLSPADAPLVEGVRFVQADLRQVACFTNEPKYLPQEIAELRGMFDVVLVFGNAGILNRKEGETLTDFFGNGKHYSLTTF